MVLEIKSAQNLLWYIKIAIPALSITQGGEYGVSPEAELRNITAGCCLSSTLYI